MWRQRRQRIAGLALRRIGLARGRHQGLQGLGAKESTRPSARPRSMSAARRVASRRRGAALADSAAPALRRVGRGRRAAWRAASPCACSVRLAAVLAGGPRRRHKLRPPSCTTLYFRSLSCGRHAFAGLHVVFHAVPGTDEMHLGVGEVEPARGLVGHDPLLDLGDGQPLAGRPALMQAEIAVGVELRLRAGTRRSRCRRRK